MESKATRRGRDFIARHGETVFNAVGRIQGDHLHTPLTRAGFAQADAMGRALRDLLGPAPRLTLWSSTAGRALQTLAIMAEHLDLDWHGTRTDARLVEIDVGGWSDRYYADLFAAEDPSIRRGIFPPAPDGERYPAIAARVGAWAADTDDDDGDRLVVMHGMSACVLRGVLTGLPDDPAHGAPIAPPLPQGSIALVAAGVETIVHRGTGQAPA
jgi:probable phosphoglycerate mutase